MCTVVHFSDPRILGQSPFVLMAILLTSVDRERSQRLIKAQALIRLVRSLARWSIPGVPELVLGSIVQDERLGLSSLSGGALTLALPRSHLS